MENVKAVFKFDAENREHTDLSNHVREIVCGHLFINVNEVDNNSSFVNDLGADSLDAVELVMAIEDEFNIEIPNEKIDNLDTVQNIVDYLLSVGKTLPKVEQESEYVPMTEEDMENSVPVSKEEEQALDESLGLIKIELRLPVSTYQTLKQIAAELGLVDKALIRTALEQIANGSLILTPGGSGPPISDETASDKTLGTPSGDRPTETSS